jgi:hypothetical protein
VRIGVTLTLAVALAAASTANASRELTKPQYIARADAICAAAHAKIVRLAPLTPMSRTAKIGDRWLAIDRTALASLRKLTPPAADRVTATRILALTDKTINTGLANVVKAAKARNTARYGSASLVFGQLLRASHAAAGRYGLSACSRW